MFSAKQALSNLTDSDKRMVSILEKSIDEKLEKEYAGEPISVEVYRFSDRIVNEIIRMYTAGGWGVSYGKTESNKWAFTFRISSNLKASDLEDDNPCSDSFGVGYLNE